MKRLFVLLLAFLFTVPASPLFAETSDDTPNVRGVFSEESYGGDTARSLLSTLFFLPRQAANAGLYGVGKFAKTVGDKDFIETVKDILYLYKRDLLWFPIVNYASGFRPTYGGGLYYTNGTLKSLAKIEFHDSDYWEYSFKTSYKFAFDRVFFKPYVLWKMEKKDDLRYHGIGGDPENDTRNRFINLTDHEYGVFTQERKKIEWGASLYAPSKAWEVRYMGFYERRSFENSGRGDNDLEDIFDLTSIPGFSQGPVTQIYNEVGVVLDSRHNKNRLAPGVRVEGYYGLSAGLRNNKADLWKTGLDLAAFLPIYKEDRILVPRAIFDYVGDFNSSVPFTEFTRHKTFRGTSEREWVRSDKASALYSLEYQWPLTYTQYASIFADYALVGKDFTSLDWDDGIWAIGFGLNTRYFDRELGRIQFSGGSEGFYVKFVVGKPLAKNTRSG